jgi:hypothetical protein
MPVMFLVSGIGGSCEVSWVEIGVVGFVAGLLLG